jgi:cellulose synthase operon protein C
MIQIPIERVRAQLEIIRAEMLHAEENPLRQGYREAACVLTRFQPRRLVPSGGGEPGWAEFLHDCEPVVTADRGDWWRLRADIRYDVLRQLGTRERMREAMMANPDRPADPAQRMLEAILDREPIRIGRLTREELVGLSMVLEWLSGILDNLPNADEVRRALPMADLLEPFRRLAALSFVGREAQLQQLSDYVGVKPAGSTKRRAFRFVRESIYSLTSRPPLMIYGPGGVGKSTLLARFILDHVEAAGKNALPFVYLDIDRVVLNPEQPISLLIEAGRQLEHQLPQFRKRIGSLMEYVNRASRSYDAMESAKSLPILDASTFQGFGDVLQAVGKPVLFVVDTFEEAQFLGAEVVHNIWIMLQQLQKAAPNLRIVVSGRAVVEGFSTEPVKLEDLTHTEALQLLRNLLGTAPAKSALEEIFDVTGGNPMSLRLGASVVEEHGIEKLRTIESRSWLVLRVRAETLQARLYGRILTHIHNPEVRKLAYPGLVVRRITADIVSEVLAEPCGLKLHTLWDADRLVNELAREVSLVERDPEDGALVHRQDVRRLMLKDLTDQVPETVVRSIHDRAVAFYEQSEGVIARAEEIYHRLMRGDDPRSVEVRWEPGVEPRLRTALEEVPTAARLWLSRKLGVTPDPRLRERAALEEWEEITARAVERHLQAGNPEGALREMRERKDRSPQSPLFRLELEALRMLGRLREAAKVAERALKLAQASDDSSIIRELLLQRAFIAETSGEFAMALTQAEEAARLLGTQPAADEALRVLVTRIRLLRKMGESNDVERRKLIDQAKQLLAPEVVRSLRRRPALLREVAAELGGVIPELLEDAIDTIGIELLDDSQEEMLAHALLDWNQVLVVEGDSSPGELAEHAGLSENTQENWKAFVHEVGTGRLKNSLLSWRSALPSDKRMDKTLVNLYRSGVDAALTRRPTSVRGVSEFDPIA